jgi:hypothetical protein
MGNENANLQILVNILTRLRPLSVFAEKSGSPTNYELVSQIRFDVRFILYK